MNTMEIKIYNKNGIIKVVKVANGKEYQMFGNIVDGEVVTIDIAANTSLTALKKTVNEAVRE